MNTPIDNVRKKRNMQQTYQSIKPIKREDNPWYRNFQVILPNSLYANFAEVLERASDCNPID
mgnify:CR=1 FL=1